MGLNTESRVVRLPVVQRSQRAKGGAKRGLVEIDEIAGGKTYSEPATCLLVMVGKRVWL